MKYTNDDKKIIGDRIGYYRRINGYTLEELGKKISDSTTKSAVLNWEKGRNLPSKRNIKKLADLFDISVDDLLYTPNQAYKNLENELSAITNAILNDPVFINNEVKSEKFRTYLSNFNSLPLVNKHMLIKDIILQLDKQDLILIIRLILDKLEEL